MVKTVKKSKMVTNNTGQWLLLGQEGCEQKGAHWGHLRCNILFLNLVVGTSAFI